MSLFDLLEIKKAKDPILGRIDITPSATPGLVVIQVHGSAAGMSMTWVLSRDRALLLADLLRKAAR